MSYVVLARKWRPMTFDDLVGQDHVSRTLANAIASGRVAHAFLFTGVRGVGKTTSARILAKALNCMGKPGGPPLTGPTATPCLECAACKEITLGTDVDVREIDGASYNGVDEVRKLQDSLPYRPARDRSKIFIVDEVHMLSQSAWNAFLKTLEEPPPHVKFIFATTEVHKVPVTILSRVQRFDFKMIPTGLIAKRLRHVLDTEKIPAEDGALSIVAREAAGSMRDAMSLLDQVIAWSAEKLDAESVARVLGVASHKVLHDLTAAVVKGDAPTCLEVIAELANQGFDLGIVARDVLGLLRDVVVAKVCPSPGDLLDMADEERKDVTQLAAATDADDLLRLHQGFSVAFDEVVKSGQVRASLEMLLVRLARRPPLLPIDDLVGRLLALEKRLAGPAGAAGSAPPRNGPPPRGGGDPRSGRDGPSGREHRSAAPAAPAPEPADEPPRPRPGPPSAPAVASPAHAPPSAPVAAPPPARSAPLSAPVAAPPPARSAPLSAPVAAPPPARGAPPSASPSTRAPGPRPPANGVGPDALAAFRAIIDLVAADVPELAAYLHHGAVRQANAVRLVLAFEAGTLFERNVRTPEAAPVILRAARAYFGTEPELSFESVTGSSVGDTLSDVKTQERVDRHREAIQRAKQHPRIAEAAQILGARLKGLHVPEE